MLMQAFEGYLVIGKSNRNFYRQYNVPEKALFHCPYYVDNDFFAAKAVQLAPQRAMIRKAWGIDDNRRVFLFCGKLIPKKNPLDLLKAATSAKTQGGHLHILMAGDGELRGQCEAFTTEHNLPATVLGFLNQTELPKAYVAADSLVLPSDYRETWGLVVNEAMACGLPAIVSDQVGCGPDLIVPRRTGFVFPTGDVEALAAILRDLSESPDLLHEMGCRAREHIAQYSVQAAADGIMAAIESVSAR
jgi:glycosyltransferase involved in cell wall biosynthesis